MFITMFTRCHYWSLSSFTVFPDKIFYAFMMSPMQATCLVHDIFLNFFILIMFNKEYKLWSSSLYNSPEPSRIFHLGSKHARHQAALRSSLHHLFPVYLKHQSSHPHKSKRFHTQDNKILRGL